MQRPIANYEFNPPATWPHGSLTALSRYLAPLTPGRSVLLWGEHLRPLVARAFTCHQLVPLVEEILPPALTPGCLVIILGGEPVLRRTGALGGTAPPLRDLT